jgi:glycosyltransferase involved in cell wall biosynthesis
MTSVHPALDGRIFHKECCSLARAGYQVTTIGPHSKDTILDLVRIKSIPREHSRFARMTRSVWRVYREALRQDADLYHFHDPELILVGLLLRAGGKDVIYDLHEDYPKDILAKDYLPAWSRPMIAWLITQLEAAVCGHFSALVAVTPSIAERFRTVNRRTVVVHNYPYPDEVVLQEARTWEARKRCVAFIGGINNQRGIREMLQAMTLLPKSLAATLELAGPIESGDVQSQGLDKHPGWGRTHYHGVLDLPKTFHILHNARAGLVLYHPIPNALESMPQKLFEYMGAGLPVIASDFPLWRRILGDSDCGILVDPLDTRAIARAIEYVLTHPIEAEQMGRRGQAAVLERYNWHLQAKKLVSLYSDVMKPLCAA